jgi:hypothetical protein
MNFKRMMISVFLFVVMGLLIAGCAGGNFATMKTEDSGRVTLDTLVADWQNYNIYYGGSIPDRPIVIFFDPKNDGKTVETEGMRWWKAGDEKTMLDAVGRVKNVPGTVPRLWKVLGPDDSLFGYAYTQLLRLNIVVVNENTIRLVTF